MAVLVSIQRRPLWLRVHHKLVKMTRWKISHVGIFPFHTAHTSGSNQMGLLLGLCQHHGVLIIVVGVVASIGSPHGTVVFAGFENYRGKGRPVHPIADILRQSATGFVVVVFKNNVIVIIHGEKVSRDLVSWNSLVSFRYFSLLCLVSHMISKSVDPSLFLIPFVAFYSNGLLDVRVEFLRWKPRNFRYEY